MRPLNTYMFLILLFVNNDLQAQALHWLSQPESEAGVFINADIIYNPKLSANGRYVSFSSPATNLVADDTNGLSDVFVKDLQTGEISRVYTTSTNQQITDYGVSTFSAPTSDGQWIAFTARTAQLPGGIGFSDEYLYIKNLSTGVVINHSDLGNGTHFEVSSDEIHLSDNGQYVFFGSYHAINPNAGFREQIYRKDLNNDSYDMLTVSFDDINGANDNTRWGDVSDNGRYVVFSTDADNIINEVLNNTGENVYLRDLQTNTTILVNRTPSGNSSAVDDSYLSHMAVSNIGQVVFKTNQSDLVLNDNNNNEDIFISNNGVITRINLTPSGQELGGTAASDFTFSGDGSTILFRDKTSQLVTQPVDDTFFNLFQYDTQTQVNSLVTLGTNNASGNDDTITKAAISTNGNRAVFTSEATNLVNQAVALNHSSLFAVDLNTDTILHISDALYDPMTSDDGSYHPRISSDQMTAVYSSDATNLTDELIEPQRNMYLLDRNSNTHQIIGKNVFSISSMSPSGRYIVITSEYFQPEGLIDLGGYHMFLYDRQNQTYTQIEEALYGEVNDSGLVVFETEKSLDANDTNGLDDVYLFNPNTQNIELVSKNNAGQAVSGFDPDIGGSGNNTWVTFSSPSEELVLNDTNGFGDVFLINWPNGSFIRTSATVAGVEGDGESYIPKISSNATHVVFLSGAKNLTAEDYSQVSEHQLIAYDINNQLHHLVSRNDNGLPLANHNTQIYYYDISDSGRYVAYEYEDDGEFGELDFATDTDNRKDVMMYDQNTQTTQVISAYLNGNNSNDHSERPKVVEDLTQNPPLIGVVFESTGGDLTGRDDHPGQFDEIILYQQGGDDLTISINIVGSGTVSGNAGINCSDQCDHDFSLGTDLTLVATASPGNTFTGWQVDFGGCQDDSNPCELVMDRAKTLHAYFHDDSDLIFSSGFE